MGYGTGGRVINGGILQTNQLDEVTFVRLAEHENQWAQQNCLIEWISEYALSWLFRRVNSSLGTNWIIRILQSDAWWTKERIFRASNRVKRKRGRSRKIPWLWRSYKSLYINWLPLRRPIQLHITNIFNPADARLLPTTADHTWLKGDQWK